MKRKTSFILNILVLIILMSFMYSSFGKQGKKVFSNEAIKEEIQTCIDKYFPFAEKMLLEHKMFYPYAAAMTKSNEFISIATSSSLGNSDPGDLLIELKDSLSKDKNLKNFKLLVIFYDAIATDPRTHIKSDAVAVLVEHIYEKKASLFYYPYSISEQNKITYSKSYGGNLGKEIFK